jgi:hypothetical protein
MLCQLATRLQPPQRAQLLADALSAARSVTSQLPRAQALSEIAINLAEPVRNEVLEEAVHAASEVRGEFWRAYALDQLIPLLSDPLREHAIADGLTAARANTDPLERAWWLTELTRHLPEPDRTAVLQEAIQAARDASTDRLSALILAELAVHLPREQSTAIFAEAQKTARSVTEGMPLWARVAARLMQLLPDRLALKMLGNAREILREGGDARPAAEIVRHVPKPLLSDALDAVNNYPAEHYRAQVLGALALYLPSPIDRKALKLAFATAEGTVARRAIITQARVLWKERITIDELELFRQCLAGLGLDDCLNVLASALDIVSQIGTARALDDCLEAVHTAGRWWPPPAAELR